MSEWITDRMPEGDRKVWVTSRGAVLLWSGTSVRDSWGRGDKVQWQPQGKPAPYVKPRPSRVEYLMDGDCFNPHPVGTIQGRMNATLNELPEGNDPLSHGGIHLRQVLPGDIDPDQAKQLVEKLRDIGGYGNDMAIAVLELVGL